MNQPPMNVFHWKQTPSLLSREFGCVNLRAPDPAKRGREVIVVDVESMVKMRREGRAWRDIANAHDCSKGTVIDRVGRAAPELLRAVRKGPKPINQIVILSRKATDRTNAIRGKA